MITLLAREQPAVDASSISGYYVHSPMQASPGYLSVITNWDGQWYESIAEEGYRSPAADDPQAASARWAWAFLPLFPLTCRAVMQLTGLSFSVAATAINLVAGAVAVILLHRLLEQQGGRVLAVCGVSLVCCFVPARCCRPHTASRSPCYCLSRRCWP